MRYLLSFLCLIIVLTSSCFAETFFSERYKMNFEIPNGWELTSDARQKRIHIVHPQKIATINITGYFYEEPVTANGLQMRRMVGDYDGWLNRFERHGTLFEAQTANADESYIAVYSKHKLQPNMSTIELMVGEYYYVKGQNAYTIGIETEKVRWATVQQVVRQVVDSFWIGEGVRPYVEKEEKTSLNWEMFGKDSQNLYQIDAKPVFNSVLQETWSYDLNHFKSFQKSSMPLITNELVVLVDGDKLVCLDSVTGQQKWASTLQNDVSSYLVSHDDILYVVQGKKLYALLLDNGDVLFKKRLSTKDVSITYYAGSLFYMDGSTLIRLAADTGKEQLKKDDLNISEFSPVAAKGKVLIAHTDELRLYRSHDGFVEWGYALESPLKYAPFMTQSLCGFLEKKDDNWYATMLDVSTGKLLWSVNLNIEDNQLVSAPAVYENNVLLSFHKKSTNKLTVQSLNSQTGNVLWTEIFADSGKPSFQPIIADNLALVSFQSQVLAIDMLTGESFYVRSMQIDKTAIAETQLVRAFKTSLFKVVKLDDGHLLVCEQ